MADEGRPASAAADAEHNVRVEVDGTVATIRLDRPPMNALNARVQDDLAAAAVRVSADPVVRAVVIYGGPKGFAAGAGIKEMAQASYARMAADTRRLQAPCTPAAQNGKPGGAAVARDALGGGPQLALCAALRVAAGSR